MIFDLDNWQEILSALKKNKLRSFMTAFGVFWGIFILIIMLAAGNGLYKGVLNDFNRWVSNSALIWARTTTIPYKGYPRGRKINFNTGDIEMLRKEIPEIQHIVPSNRLGGPRGAANVTRGLKDGAFTIHGSYPEIQFIKLMDIVRGRFLNSLDLKENRKMAVIGDGVYQLLFEPEENPIGQYLNVDGVHFKVVGIFNSKREGDEAEEETLTIFIPFSTFQNVFNYGDLVGWFSLTPTDDTPASEVEHKAIALLGSQHQISPDDHQAFGRWNNEKEFKRIVNLFYGIYALTWVVGTFTLIAGIIGVSNIMLFIVKERTREIGIKRAIGATPQAIVGQIILESTFLTTFAGYFGLIAGVGAVELISFSLTKMNIKINFFKNPEIDLVTALAAIGILMVFGAIAGLIPGSRAISVKPVEAIREK